MRMWQKLAIGQPGHVIAGPHVDVGVADRVVQLAGDRPRLGKLLRFQALALQHVQEVGVAAEVELVGVVQPHAAVAEQVGQHAVADRRPELALHVVADHRADAAFRSVPPTPAGRR